MAQCPVHEDRSPSLSLRQSRGRALVYCHAGCQTPDVLQALGLTSADLFDNPRGIDYTYADGRIVHRTPDKAFYQSGNRSDRAVLYVAPGLDLAGALAAGVPIFLPEGEQDVDLLGTMHIAAVTSPMGAKNWAKCDYSPLAGAPNLVIIQDRDDAGRQRGNGLYHHLRSLGAQVVIVEAAAGKDVTDHIMAGLTLEQLVPAPSPEIGPEADRWMPEFDDSMMPILPMHWAWKGMIPLGGLTLLAGTGGIGKTSFATYLIAQLQRGALQGNLQGSCAPTVWIGNEDSWQRTILPRFVVNGGDRASRTFCRFRMPPALREEYGDLPTLPEHLGLIERAIDQTGAKAVLIDPILSLLGPGLNADKAADVRRALQPLNDMAERRQIAVLGIAHLNKNVASTASNRLSGSHAWRDVPRATITFAMDEDAGMVILSNTKSNVGIDGRSFAYRKRVVLTEIDGVPIDTVAVDWVGEVTRTVDDVMSDEAVMGRGGELKREIVDFVLHAGRSVSTKEVLDEMIDERMVASGPANVKMALGRLVKAGVVARLGRGFYGPPDARVHGNPSRESSSVVTSVTPLPHPGSPRGVVTEVTAPGLSREGVTQLCAICGYPLADRLIEEGERTHPTCG